MLRFKWQCTIGGNRRNTKVLNVMECSYRRLKLIQMNFLNDFYDDLFLDPELQGRSGVEIRICTQSGVILSTRLRTLNPIESDRWDDVY